MLTIQTVNLFLATIIPLCFVPAPDNTLIFIQSTFQGRKAGLALTLGVCTGFTFHVIAVVAGLAVVIQTSVILFNCLKIIGAGYLLYLAWQAFNLRFELDAMDNDSETFFTSYRRGFLINFLNPMNPLFLLVLLPQFVKPEQGAANGQLIQLGLLAAVSLLIIFGLFSLAGDKLGRKIIKLDGFQTFIRYVSSITIGVLAIVLIFQ